MPRHEMKRTCKRCNTDWYVSIKASRERKPDRFAMAGAKWSAVGGRLSPSGMRGAGDMALANLERKAERVERINSCPNCGSSSFTQKKVRI